MIRSTIRLAVMAAVTSVVAIPLTRDNADDDVTWSKLCRHDVSADLRPRHCADAGGNDVTVTVTATTTVNTTQRHVRSYYPYPYDPMLGWYTAAIISGLLLTFVFCQSMDRAKNVVVDYYDARHEKRLQSLEDYSAMTYVVADTATTTVLTSVNDTQPTVDEQVPDRTNQATDDIPDSCVPLTTDQQDHQTTGQPSNESNVPSASNPN